MSNFKLLTGFLAIILLSVSHGKLLRRYFFTGYLFEDDDMPSSPYVDFADVPKEEWKDLSIVASKHGLEGHSQFCSVGPGVWLGYPKVGFAGSYVQLIIGEMCQDSNLIKSLQPLGFTLGHQDANVALFTAANFASPAKILYKGSTSGDFKSMIYVGWAGVTVEGTMKGGKKKKVCLSREYGIDTVCLLPDVAGNLGMETKLSITQGCDFVANKNLTVHFLQYCFEHGNPIVRLETEFTPTKFQEVCKGAGGGGKDGGEKKEGAAPEGKAPAGGGGSEITAEFGQIMDVWKSRVLYESEMFGATHLNNLDTHPKVDAFLQFVDIFVAGCPSVDPHYISLLSHVFLNHMKALWKENPGMIEPAYDDSYIYTFDYLSHCWADMTQRVEQQIMEANTPICRPDFPAEPNSAAEALEMDMTMSDDEFDSVIDQVWLMLNFIAPYCSHQSNYHTNSWVSFPDMFKKVYLKPLEAQWMKPGIWAKIYPIMFHGYDLDKMHGQVWSCVQGAYSLGKTIDPVMRTSGFNKIFFNVKNNKTLGGSKNGTAPLEGKKEEETPTSENPVEGGAEPAPEPEATKAPEETSPEEPAPEEAPKAAPAGRSMKRAKAQGRKTKGKGKGRSMKKKGRKGGKDKKKKEGKGRSQSLKPKKPSRK